jgi:hypothetical protein
MTTTTRDFANAGLTAAEARFCDSIRQKDQALRHFLDNNKLPADMDARDWLAYLTGIKSLPQLGKIDLARNEPENS